MFLTSRLLVAEGIRHGFSTRRGGVSTGPFASLNLGRSVGDDPAAVAENLRRLAVAAGVAGFATVHQVHGDRLLAGGPELSPEAEADGVLSVPGGRAPAIKTADCVPVLLYHRPSGRVAAVHAGWRGTSLRIAAGAVRALTCQGASGQPDHDRNGRAGGAEVVAAIGPCIGRCCYEVSVELAASFASAFGADVVEGRRLDLALANRRALVEAGVVESAIEVVGGCTSCDVDRHFSHRRDNGRTGRHLSWISPPAEACGASSRE